VKYYSKEIWVKSGIYFQVLSGQISELLISLNLVFQYLVYLDHAVMPS